MKLAPRCIAWLFGMSAVALAGTAAAETGWTVTGDLNVPRWLHSATLLDDGRVLVVGGMSTVGRNAGQTSEIYDPVAGTWTLTGALGSPRVGHTATLLADGRVLVTGSDTGGAELYDPATGIWSPTGAMSERRSSHTATGLLDGTVLVAGGWDRDWLATAELYDPVTGLWSPVGALNVGRYGHTATLMADGRVLVFGGSNDGDLASTLGNAEIYDPVLGTWTLVADEGPPGIYQTTTTLPTGTVLVTGGYNWPPTSSRQVQQFEPSLGTWSAAPHMAWRRDNHTATVLASGEVLVAGGLAWGDSPRLANVGETEVLNPRTGMWRSAGALNTARARHTATLLDDGRVLVAGGAVTTNFRDAPLASAELYQAPPEVDCKNHYILARPCAVLNSFRRR